MYYNDVHKQWASLVSTGDMGKFGERLRDELIERRVKMIDAGTVLAFTTRRGQIIMFQTLQNILLASSLTNQTLIGYEPGSLRYLFTKDDTVSIIPTIRFKDCRLPSDAELNEYLRRPSV